jgi:ketosteroid isomerase-like protein
VRALSLLVIAPGARSQPRRGAGDTERAVSEQNLEVLRAMFDAFQRGDEPAMLELVDPSCVFTPLPETPGVQSYHGHEGLLHAFDEVGPGAWDDFSIEVRDMRDFDDHVLAWCRWWGRGKGSGIQVEADIYALMTLRGGKLVRWRFFSSEQQALDAADSR